MSNYCKECEKANKKTYNTSDEFRSKRRKYKREYRQKIINKLGGKCACCGESQFEFLQFDHINNDGADHRREVGSAGVSVSRVAANLDRFQVLCCNCNFAKGAWGVCPHQQ